MLIVAISGMNVHCVPGKHCALSTLSELFCLFITVTLGRWCSHYFHFTDEETEIKQYAQGNVDRNWWSHNTDLFDP